MGAVYGALGQEQETLRYYQLALAISREVADRGGVARTLSNTGALYFRQGRNDEALACFLLARDIYEEVLSPNREGVQRWIGGLREEAGEEEFAALLAKVEPQASLIVEQALAITREVGDRGGEGTTLNNLGAVYNALAIHRP